MKSYVNLLEKQTQATDIQSVRQLDEKLDYFATIIYKHVVLRKAIQDKSPTLAKMIASRFEKIKNREQDIDLER